MVEVLRRDRPHVQLHALRALPLPQTARTRSRRATTGRRHLRSTSQAAGGALTARSAPRADARPRLLRGADGAARERPWFEARARVRRRARPLWRPAVAAAATGGPEHARRATPRGRAESDAAVGTAAASLPLRATCACAMWRALPRGRESRWSRSLPRKVVAFALRHFVRNELLASSRTAHCPKRRRARTRSPPSAFACS